MEIVKKNVLSIICGAVALLALISLLWPISGMYSDENDKVLKPRVAADGELKTLVNSKRAWPTIPDVSSGAKASLDRFPNEDVIKAGVAIKDSVHTQAVDMRDRTEQNQNAAHPLLLPGSLPDPKDLSFTFQRLYLEKVQDKPGPNGTVVPSKLKEDLRGGLPPTDLDVLDAAQKLWLSEYKPKVITLIGKDVNFDEVAAQWQKECAGLQAKLRLETSLRTGIYVEPDWISIQKAMLDTTGKSANETDIWFAQNMLWVQLDLIDGIKRINTGAHNVQEATVKHIFRIDLADDMYVQGGNNGSGQAPAAPTDAPVKVYGLSPTGRVCNPLYDVLQFQIVINVEAAKTAIVLKELQRGKLITITHADMTPVDGIAAAEAGYVYGNVPVCKLKIRGEELFLRDWTVKYMPEPIKQMLQVPPPAPANGQQRP